MAAIARRPETANSRAIIRMAIQPGMARTWTSEIMAAEISSLSAIGSSSVPIVVTCFQPARQVAVQQIRAGRRQENGQRQPIIGYGHAADCSAKFSWTNAATSIGTKKIRSNVSALGRFIAQNQLYRAGGIYHTA